MSCGKEHATPCEEVLAEVYLYLDAECDAHHVRRIREHLRECHDCLAQYGVEREVKALVARCCGAESAPDHLRERLRVKLTQIVTGQQGSAEVTSVEMTVTELRDRHD